MVWLKTSDAKSPSPRESRLGGNTSLGAGAEDGLKHEGLEREPLQVQALSDREVEALCEDAGRQENDKGQKTEEVEKARTPGRNEEKGDEKPKEGEGGGAGLGEEGADGDKRGDKWRRVARAGKAEDDQ